MTKDLWTNKRKTTTYSVVHVVGSAPNSVPLWTNSINEQGLRAETAKKDKCTTV